MKKLKESNGKVVFHCEIYKAGLHQGGTFLLFGGIQCKVLILVHLGYSDGNRPAIGLELEVEKKDWDEYLNPERLK